ncbi:SHOCT domain-containing protein [Malikia sp.]|uniref:SHOCT domain-containing protein n=1 Tax=Malikia sp. TaxID=2070706 RepID=UPI0026084B93|nr:SHOCT domain-containing protein [Malikia sp.]MDD2729886.1 SHOCT domain-containing protein [Malikia sp.]
MRPLTPSGQQAVNQLAQRHGFSVEAVLVMLDAVLDGNGSMAQFSHPEFGGSGQWMAGGMTMLSDMFNHYLKGRVDNLCAELAALLASQADLIQRGSVQPQDQNGASLFAPPGPDWWGPELRWPDSSGAQNGVRYAYFSQAHRLAIEVNGQVTIYDTLDHQIGGISQQQGYGGSLSFNSQYGLIDVNRLPVLSIDGQVVATPATPVAAAPQPPLASDPGAWQPAPARPLAGESDIFTLIERLAELHQRGLLSDLEYGSKKAELLSRL